MKTLFIGKSISVRSNSSSVEDFVLMALLIPVIIVLRMDHRVYNPPRTIAPTPTYLTCCRQIMSKLSTELPAEPQPFIRPYIGTSNPKPIIPPRKINDAILIPTIKPTDNRATERSIPA